MNMLLRLLCGLVGVALLLSAFIPGAMAFHSAREWWLVRSSPSYAYTDFLIQFEIGGRTVDLTLWQSLAAFGGATVLLLAFGLAGCYFAVSRGEKSPR